MLCKNSFLREFVCYSDYGILRNSGKFSGLTSEEARQKITEFVEGKIIWMSADERSFVGFDTFSRMHFSHTREYMQSTRMHFEEEEYDVLLGSEDILFTVRPQHKQ